LVARNTSPSRAGSRLFPNCPALPGELLLKPALAGYRVSEVFIPYADRIGATTLNRWASTIWTFRRILRLVPVRFSRVAAAMLAPAPTNRGDIGMELAIASLLFFIVGALRSLVVDLTYVEIGLLLLCAFGLRFFLRAGFDRVERAAARLANRRAVCIALAFFAPILFRVAVLPWAPVPTPWVPDEFSHLLIADSLAHGRLANPMHPLWMHFESIHIVTAPVYASVYFPGLGIVVALGQVLGNRWIGIRNNVQTSCTSR
jgi:hypothetical protein